MYREDDLPEMTDAAFAAYAEYYYWSNQGKRTQFLPMVRVGQLVDRAFPKRVEHRFENLINVGMGV